MSLKMVSAKIATAAILTFTIMLKDDKTSAQAVVQQPAESVKFIPFDKSSIPLISRLPRDATKEDARIFSQLQQDETQLVTCDWKSRGLEEARVSAHRLGFGDLSTNNGNNIQFGSLIDKLTAPLNRVYYGKVDKDDLWVSKYWGDGAFTRLVKIFPSSIKSAALDGTVATQIQHEGMGAYIKNYKSAYILYRAQPVGDRGFQGIVFLVDANFVQFKELYLATKNYCSTYTDSDSVRVVGWKRTCIGGSQDVSGVKTARVANEENTMMVVGFACR